jgi:hypothetical protein
MSDALEPGDIPEFQNLNPCYTVMPLRVIGVSLFPVWKWNRGQVLFKAI